MPVEPTLMIVKGITLQNRSSISLVLVVIKDILYCIMLFECLTLLLQKEETAPRPKIDYLAQMKKDRKLKERQKRDAAREKKKTEAEEESKQKKKEKKVKPNYVIIDETKREEKENEVGSQLELETAAVSEDELDDAELEPESQKVRRVSEFTLFPEDNVEQAGSGASGQCWIGKKNYT